MIVLYSKQDYEDGEFFKYLNVGFLALEGESTKEIHYKEGKPEIFSIQEVKGFFEQIGQNTQYIIHPEEIIADNFAFALQNKSDLPNLEIVDEIKKLLLMKN